MNFLDFFKPVADDQSIAYLSALFGGLATLPGEPGILAALFKMFNMIVLVVGLFVIVYTVIVGLLTTAHEGEFLGKKFHGLWTPLRMVIGIMALIPTPVGYSGLQVILMWVFIQGVGAADTLWNTTLAYVNANGFYGPMTDSPSTLQGNVESHMKQLFQGLTCLASVNLPQDSLAEVVKRSWAGTTNNNFIGYAGKKINAGGGYRVDPPYLEKKCTGQTCILTLFSSNGKVNCGSLTYANPNIPYDNPASPKPYEEDRRRINKAQQDVLIGSQNVHQDQAEEKIILSDNANPKSIIEQLYYLATFFARSDQQYINFYFTSTTNPNNQADKGLPVEMGGAINDGWGWVDNYCIAKGIVPCCRVGNEGSECRKEKAVPVNNDYIREPTAAGSKSSPNPTDANLAAVSEIYFPYNIHPNAMLSSTFSTMTVDDKKLSEFKPENIGVVGFYDAVIKNISKAYANAIATAIPPPQEISKGDLPTASKYGWLTAGAFYYYISTETKGSVASANPTISFNLENSADDYRNNINVTANLFTPPGSNSTTAQYAGVTAALKDTSLKLFMTNVTGGNYELYKGYQQLMTGVKVNPLVRIQSYGQQLLLTVEVMYPIVLAVDIGFAALASLTSVTVFGNGFAQGMYPLLATLHSYVSPMFLALFAVLASIGGLLAVYLPLVPYVIFTVTALGWFISIIEAMVAAPLIAIGILSPSAQHHEILGKADQALMTVFGIFLKPSLMIFGLVVAMLLASVAVSLVNVTFEYVVYSIVQQQQTAGGVSKQSYIDFLELIFFMASYLFLIIAVLNKCFTMIAILPGKVMSYIGGQAESPDLEALGEVKGAVSGASSKAGGAMAQGAQGARTAGKAYKGAAKQRDAAKTGDTQQKDIKTTTTTPPGGNNTETPPASTGDSGEGLKAGKGKGGDDNKGESKKKNG